MGWQDAPVVDSSKPKNAAWESAPVVGQAAAAPAAKPESKGSFWGAGAGLGETALAMGTGAIAKPVSEVMGMTAMAKDVLTGDTEGRAPQFQQDIQRAMTYQPRTEQGKLYTGNLAKVGGLWSGAGEKLFPSPPGSSTGKEMAMGGAREAWNQIPAFAGLKGAPAAAEATQAGLKTAARSTMMSALKPTLKAKQTGKAGPAVETMLDERLNVSPGGVETLQDRIHILNDRVAAEIQGSNAVVDKQHVGYRLQGVMDDFEKQVNATTDLVAIQKAWDEFLDHPLLAGDKIPVELAQKMKQGTYKRLADKYGELGSADVEAQKALARGLKEEIANAVPKVRPLNAEESELLNALSVSERRVMMEANKNPMGLALLTTSPTKWAAFMADRSGLAKSIIAHMLNRASEAVPSTALGGGIAGIGTSTQAGALPIPPKSFAQAKREPKLMRQPELTAINTGPYSDAEKEKRYQEWKRRQED